jgi:hypothetical protein
VIKLAKRNTAYYKTELKEIDDKIRSLSNVRRMLLFDVWYDKPSQNLDLHVSKERRQESNHELGQVFWNAPLVDYSAILGRLGCISHISRLHLFSDPDQLRSAGCGLTAPRWGGTGGSRRSADPDLWIIHL